MASGGTTSSAVAGPEGLSDRVKVWLLLSGSRLAIAAGILLLVVGVFAGLIAADLIAVGPASSAATLFGSGLTSGVVTLITIALSINQLVISRVFGSPAELTERLDGTTELRRTVVAHAGEPSTPNDPAAFLSMIGRAIQDRAWALEDALAEGGWDPPEDLETCVRDIGEYGGNIDGKLEDEASIVDVIGVVIGTAYAYNLTALRHHRNAHESSMPKVARREFDALEDLLESVAVARQFFKTLSLQEDFARLSRRVVYAGLLALGATISLTLIYRSASTTVPAPLRLPVVSIGIGVIVAPLAIFVAYILRSATIAERTVSVGPFVPPGPSRRDRGR